MGVGMVMYLWLWIWYGYGLYLAISYGYGTTRTRAMKPPCKTTKSRCFITLENWRPNSTKTPNVRSQKCVSSRQAWTKHILHTKTARFFQHLVEGCVISGDAKMQRYRQSRQCPTRRGRRQPPPRRQWASRITGRQNAVSPVQCRRILAPVNQPTTTKPKGTNQ